jgi:hypothetical protein
MEAAKLIQKTLKRGQSVRWGQIYTHTWIRQNINGFISDKDTRTILRLIDPTGSRHRKQQSRRKRDRYTVKGPGRHWSVDGHDKLAQYGFQV